LDKLNLSPRFPGESGLGHSERAGEQHGRGRHRLTPVAAPQGSPDAEGLRQSQGQAEKASGFAGRLESRRWRGCRSHTLRFRRSSLQTPTQLHPEAAAHTSTERVQRGTQLPRGRRRCRWVEGALWLELGELGSCAYCGPWSYIKLPVCRGDAILGVNNRFLEDKLQARPGYEWVARSKAQEQGHHAV